MARYEKRSFVEDLIYAPWWISAFVLVTGNIGIRYIIPAWFSGSRTPGVTGSMLSGGVAQAVPAVATMFNVIFGFAFILSAGRAILAWSKQR